MSRRHADNWSHPSHYLVDPYHWSHLRPGVQSICLLFVSWQSDHFWLRYSKFYIWPWKFKVKVMAKVKPAGHIWAPEFNRCVCFSFRGNRTIFGWDIANSIFDLENSSQGYGQGQTRWSHLSLRVQSLCLLFVSWQSDHFWLRYSKFYIWPWKFKVKVMAKVKPAGHIWAPEINWYVCFSFRGNRTIFGCDIANSIFDLENSRSRSWPRSNPLVTFEPQSSIAMFAFRFVAIGPFLAEI